MNEVLDSRTAGFALTDDADLAAEFDVRVRECSALVIRVAYSVLRNRADAEDVAQEAFVRAYRKIGSLRAREKFRSWLVRMTWRLALNSRRGARRRDGYEQAVARDSLTRRGALDPEEQAQHSDVWMAIDALPDRLRLVVVLAAIEGHSSREVAALLRVSEGTVRSRLFRARKRLQDQLR
jgi:RNA polymerase sigma-70 factor (ECF subfamily)